MEETETPETGEEVENPEETAGSVDLLGMTSNPPSSSSTTSAPAGAAKHDLLDFGAAAAPVDSSDAAPTANGVGNDMLNLNGHEEQVSTNNETDSEEISNGGLLLDVSETRKMNPVVADPFATSLSKDPFAATPVTDPFAAQPAVSVPQNIPKDPFLVNPSPAAAVVEEAVEPVEQSTDSVENSIEQPGPELQQEPPQPQQAEMQPESPSTAGEAKPPVDEAKVAVVMAIPSHVLDRFSPDYPMDGKSREECIRQDPVAFHKSIVRSVLRTYDPNRVGLVDKLFIKYRGKEDQIVQKMIQKYKIKPEDTKSPDSIPASRHEKAGKAEQSADGVPQTPAETQTSGNDGAPVETNQSGEPLHAEGGEAAESVPPGAPENPPIEAQAPTDQVPASVPPNANASVAESQSGEAASAEPAQNTEGRVAEPVARPELLEPTVEVTSEPVHNARIPPDSIAEVPESVASEEAPDAATDPGTAVVDSEPTLVELPPRSISSRSASAPHTPTKDDNEAPQRAPMNRAQSVPAAPSPPKPTFDESVVMDLQNALEAQVILRNEAEERAEFAETRVAELEDVVSERDQLLKELEETKASLVSMTSDRSSLELELAKLREVRDEFERKETVLSNRLNAAKKKEGVKANEAQRLEERAKALETVLEATKTELDGTSKSKASVERELENKTADYEARLKQAEQSLSEERRLNEDRKKKMKAFVESKQEELRETKAQGDELTLELSQTNRSLREHHNRWKQLHAQWVQSQTRNRELQRDLNKLKKEQDTIQRKGGKLEIQMARSAKESEEHKNKRLTAKNELMTVLQTLETEREVATRLRDSIKFTFTPKALSQQQLLKESLRDFERELVQLSTRLNRPLPPAPERPELFALVEDEDSESATDEAHQQPQSRSQLDTAHLLKNLEDETQRVSQCIMALTNSIERMHVVLAGAGERNCTSVLAELFAGTSVATTDETTSMTGNRPTPLGRRYGQVPQD